MGAINVANFNEFDMQLDMTMPFALDELPAPDTWMAAAAQTMARRQDITLLDSEMGDSSLSLASAGIDKRGRSSRARSSLSSALDNTMEDDEEEEEEGVDGLADDWAATEFDPRDESADLMGENEIVAVAPDATDESIEFGRNASAASRGARGLSISAIESEGRASLESGNMKLGAEFGDDIEPMEPLQDDEEEQMDDNILPAEDDAPLDDFADMDGPSLGGPSLGGEEEEPTPAKRKPKSTTNKKKRALPLDDKVEIARSVIKQNLEDTSDIVRMALPPRQRPRVSGPTKTFPSLEERMHMPNVTGIAPELKNMFSWVMRDDPLPFRLRKGYNYAGPVNKKSRTGSALSLNSEAEEEEVHNEEHVGDVGAQEEEEPQDIEEMRGNNEEQQDEFDFQAQEDEYQPEEEPYLGEEEEVAPPLDMSTTVDSGNGSFLANAGRFELGAVNDIQADDDAMSSNGYASEEEISKAQWHPHTKKVMGMLEGEFDKKDSVSYNAICGVNKGHKVGRRTAAGVFFELLQLKTWDYIEVKQDGSYEDITVTKGARFDEGIPTAKADQ
jgi:cohesin complex subunit SCC1